MSYKTNITKEFKQKGYWLPDQQKIVSTKKNTEGVEFDIIEALDKVGADGMEIDISIVQKDSIDGIEE